MKPILPGMLLTAFISLSGLFGSNALYAQVQTGKSYVNISKGATGGTFEPGDTLEIRAAIAVGSGTTIKYVRYNDTIDNNFTYLPNSLKILTNEGLTFRAYTDAAGDDKAMFDNTTKTLRINLGSTATNATSTGNGTATAGTIVYTDKPSFYNNVSIMVASFRVQIKTTLSFNTLINLPGGAFRYTNSSGSALSVNFLPNDIMLFQNLGSCSNYVGANAVIENNGTFGNGNTQNRNASAIIPGYAFVNFAANKPNDGFYSIANNSSATGATNNAVAKPNATRVFTIWDIIGDHTGAASPTAGNPAVSPGTSGGYMAVVNASYATSPAIQQDVDNLCTNTYYDFSAWFRNICSLCACDSNGVGATNAAFNGPYKPGVKPNLTFQLDGIDYYTSGDIPYTGLWEKKGFTYLTGAAQTGFTLTIRNNSPGGGGNDWAMDDISLSTCEPNVDLNITPVLLGCSGVQVNFSVNVKCYFPNYTFYKWQKSTDGGLTWTDTGISGDETPAYTGGQWEYTTTYPSFTANLIDSGHRYRVAVATSADNLANGSCAYSNSQNTMLKIIDCAAILDVQMNNFNGQVADTKALLKWFSSKENNLTRYEIEKSEDGRKFIKIGSVVARNRNNTSFYEFTDAASLIAPAYYRLKMVGREGMFSYSKIILLSDHNAGLKVNSISNPFQHSLLVNYAIPRDGKIAFRLYDSYGKLVNEYRENSANGLHIKTIEGLDQLATGIYTVHISFENERITRRVVKVN
jgi:hypothetical protein